MESLVTENNIRREREQILAILYVVMEEKPSVINLGLIWEFVFLESKARLKLQITWCCGMCGQKGAGEQRRRDHMQRHAVRNIGLEVSKSVCIWFKRLHQTKNTNRRIPILHQVGSSVNVERYTSHPSRTPEQSRDRFVQLSAELSRLDVKMDKVKKELNKCFRDPKNKW